VDIDYTSEQIKQVLIDLSRPFPLSEVKWRVTATNKDVSKGLVVPYADPRAYTQRLNDVISSAGWSIEYKTETMTGLQRMVNNKFIQSGKVIAVATVSIFGISSKSSMGEMWADDGNAVTRAEAQAFKRAAEMFEVGLYFRKIYELAKGSESSSYWVPLDQRKVPTRVPALPAWALLPEDQRYAAKVPTQTLNSGQQQQASPKQGQQGNVQQMQPRQQSPATVFEANKQKYISALGQPLFASIVAEIDRLENAGNITGDKFVILKNTLAAKENLLNLVSAKAADMPIGALDALLDRYQIRRLSLIPNYSVLDSMATEFGLRLAKAA
jgi:hypothetical protein